MENVTQQEQEVVVEKQPIKINAENPRVLLCVYGTLREGRGNWHHFLKNRSTHLGTFKTEPIFTMYGKRAGFPIVVDEGTTRIECDVFEVTNDATLQNIHQLEGCTGIPGHSRNWYDIMEIDTPFGKAYMYVQHEHLSQESIIESGNWNNR